MKKSPFGSQIGSEDSSRKKTIPVGLISVRNVHQECDVSDKILIVGNLERKLERVGKGPKTTGAPGSAWKCLQNGMFWAESKGNADKSHKSERLEKGISHQRPGWDRDGKQRSVLGLLSGWSLSEHKAANPKKQTEIWGEKQRWSGRERLSDKT